MLGGDRTGSRLKVSRQFSQVWLLVLLRADVQCGSGRAGRSHGGVAGWTSGPHVLVSKNMGESTVPGVSRQVGSCYAREGVEWSPRFVAVADG